MKVSMDLRINHLLYKKRFESIQSTGAYFNISRCIHKVHLNVYTQKISMDIHGSLNARTGRFFCLIDHGPLLFILFIREHKMSFTSERIA